jgi:hypothetical protein
VRVHVIGRGGGAGFYSGFVGGEGRWDLECTALSALPPPPPTHRLHVCGSFVVEKGEALFCVWVLVMAGLMLCMVFAVPLLPPRLLLTKHWNSGSRVAVGAHASAIPLLNFGCKICGTCLPGTLVTNNGSNLLSLQQGRTLLVQCFTTPMLAPFSAPAWVAGHFANGLLLLLMMMMSLCVHRCC